MRIGILFFLAGILLLQQLDDLPSILWSALLLAFVPVAVFSRYPLNLLGWCVAGFLWALFQANLIMQPHLPAELEGKDVVVTGTIVSIPKQRSRYTRFEFDVASMDFEGQSYVSPGKVRISWYKDYPHLKVGQRWQFQIRLKRPYGFMNPGGFDYAGWLFQERIRATGYIRKSSKNHKLSAVTSSKLTEQFRQLIRDKTDFLASRQPTLRPVIGLIQGLAIGERSRISDTQWEWLRDTGTSHLLAISGLHVGLVAGLAFMLIQRLWRLSPRLMLVYPAPKAAAIAAFFVALLYSAMAGFSVPTQRALIMLSVVMLMLISNRHMTSSRVLSWALLAVLLFDSLAVLAAGFWLSFIAVAAILYGINARVGQCHHGLYQVAFQWLRAQWWVTLGLMPITLLFFQQVSLVSPIANLIAIPLVSLLIVPLALVGSLLLLLSVELASFVLMGAGYLLSGLMACLSFLSELPLSTYQAVIPDMWTATLAGIGVLTMLAPRGVPARWLGTLMLLPVLWVKFDRPDEGTFWFSLLDVGQGLAAVVQTREHVLVYDTGARFSYRFNAGDAVLVPFLRQAGYSDIDRLVISHGDNDHLGGASAMPSDEIFSSVPDKLSAKLSVKLPSKNIEPVKTCLAGQRWRWDGVIFEFIHPEADYLNEHNDSSCVLMIGAGQQRVLLTGDIEKAAEARLVRHKAEELQADILVVPHHGSKTSSTEAFIQAVSPQYALFPVGYRNRYHFPHKDILKRYHSKGIQTAEVAATGTIRFIVGYDQKALVPEYYRDAYSRFWHKQID